MQLAFKNFTFIPAVKCLILGEGGLPLSTESIRFLTDNYLVWLDREAAVNNIVSVNINDRTRILNELAHEFSQENNLCVNDSRSGSCAWTAKLPELNAVQQSWTVEQVAAFRAETHKLVSFWHWLENTSSALKSRHWLFNKLDSTNAPSLPKFATGESLLQRTMCCYFKMCGVTTLKIFGTNIIHFGGATVGYDYKRREDFERLNMRDLLTLRRALQSLFLNFPTLELELFYSLFIDGRTPGDDDTIRDARPVCCITKAENVCNIAEILNIRVIHNDSTTAVDEFVAVLKKLTPSAFLP